jgi:hypothetical protein
MIWPFKKKTETPHENATMPAQTELVPSQEMIDEAKTNPNGWVYKIQGNFGPNDAVPPESIVGAYKVDSHGNLTGEFMPNPNYSPR